MAFSLLLDEVPASPTDGLHGPYRPSLLPHLEVFFHPSNLLAFISPWGIVSQLCLTCYHNGYHVRSVTALRHPSQEITYILYLDTGKEELPTPTPVAHLPTAPETSPRPSA